MDGKVRTPYVYNKTCRIELVNGNCLSVRLCLTVIDSHLFDRICQIIISTDRVFQRVLNRFKFPRVTCSLLTSGLQFKFTLTETW